MKKTILSMFLLTGIMTAGVNASPALFDKFFPKGQPEAYEFGEPLTDWAKVSFSKGMAGPQLNSSFRGKPGLGLNLANNPNLYEEIALASLGIKGNTLEAGDPISLPWSLNPDYELLKKGSTPLLTTGVTYRDFGAARSEVSETSFSWELGGRSRWDISDRCFIKSAYRVNWTPDHSTMSPGISLALGFSF